MDVKNIICIEIKDSNIWNRISKSFLVGAPFSVLSDNRIIASFGVETRE